MPRDVVRPRHLGERNHFPDGHWTQRPQLAPQRQPGAQIRLNGDEPARSGLADNSPNFDQPFLKSNVRFQEPVTFRRADAGEVAQCQMPANVQIGAASCGQNLPHLLGSMHRDGTMTVQDGQLDAEPRVAVAIAAAHRKGKQPLHVTQVAAAGFGGPALPLDPLFDVGGADLVKGEPATAGRKALERDPELAQVAVTPAGAGLRA
jgi:hypothetical protein